MLRPALSNMKQCQGPVQQHWPSPNRKSVNGYASMEYFDPQPTAHVEASAPANTSLTENMRYHKGEKEIRDYLQA